MESTLYSVKEHRPEFNKRLHYRLFTSVELEWFRRRWFWLNRHSPSRSSRLLSFGGNWFSCAGYRLSTILRPFCLSTDYTVRISDRTGRPRVIFRHRQRRPLLLTVDYFWDFDGYLSLLYKTFYLLCRTLITLINSHLLLWGFHKNTIRRLKNLENSANPFAGRTSQTTWRLQRTQQDSTSGQNETVYSGTIYFGTLRHIISSGDRTL
jgi:hypothetical protein